MNVRKWIFQINALQESEPQMIVSYTMFNIHLSFDLMQVQFVRLHKKRLQILQEWSLINNDDALSTKFWQYIEQNFNC